MPEDNARAITIHLAAARDAAERRAEGDGASPWSSVATQIGLVATLLDLPLGAGRRDAKLSVNQELKQVLRVLASPGTETRWGLADRTTARRWLSDIVEAVGGITG